MSEPTSSVIAAGAFSAALAMLGIPPLALLWAFIGAMVAMVFTPPESRGGAILAVIAGGLSGAAIGHGSTDIAGRVMPSLVGSDAILIFVSLVCGAGAKPLLSSAITRAKQMIEGCK